MPSDTIFARIDAWTNQSAVNQNNSQGERLSVSNLAGAIRRALIYFTLPDPIRSHKNVNVKTATLRLYIRKPWTGTSIPTAERQTLPWKERTLTFTNGPTVSTANSATATVVNGVDGDEVTFNLAPMLQQVSNSSTEDFYGVRLSIDTNGPFGFYSSEATRELRPQLDITWNRNPQAPNKLRPGGSRSVTHSRPTLTYQFRDNFGDQRQQRNQVVVENAAGTSTLYDSTLVTNPDQQFDLSNPPTGAPAFTALTSGTAVRWRVRAEDADGRLSDWSEYQTFQYDSVGTLTITNPPVGATVADRTPPITWTFTGRTQDRVELTLWEYNDQEKSWDRIHRQSETVFAGNSYTIPKNLITKKLWNYRIGIDVWDTLDREDTPANPAYVRQRRVFQYVRDNTPANVTGLTPTLNPNGTVTLAFSRTARPDYFALDVDGEGAENQIDPDDIATSPGATSYSMSYWGAEPRKAITLEVFAVVNSAGVLKESSGVSTSVTTTPVGKWILAPDEGISVWLGGQDAPSMDIGESGTTHFPIGRRSPVRVLDSIRGYEGSVSGLIMDQWGVTARTYRRNLERIKGLRKPVRLVTPRMNIPVVLEEMSISDATEYPTLGFFNVTVAFRQSDEFFRVTR